MKGVEEKGVREWATLEERRYQISKRGDQNSRRGGPKSRVLGEQAFELGHAQLLWGNNMCGSGIVVLVNTKKREICKNSRKKMARLRLDR